jgi:putative ABC transport system ATP-binding protein
VESEDVTAIVATHDPVLIDIADRVIELSDGTLVSDSQTAADERERYSVHR